MSMLKYAVILMLGILLFGCVSNDGGAYNITNYTDGNPDKNLSGNTGVQPGALEISVPSELPIAYVGKPISYSFCDPQPPSGTTCGTGTATKNPVGGKPPYEFTYGVHKIAYDGSEKGSAMLMDAGSNGLLTLTAEQFYAPQEGDEGKYVLKVCVTSSGDRYNPVCKNTTLYIMSDTVKVKGSGKVTSSVVWDPRAFIAVMGRAGDVEKSLERPERTTLVSVSQIPDVSLNVSTPPKDNNPGSPYSLGSSGGASVEFEMVANSTGVSQSVTGDAPCGSLNKDGSLNTLNIDNFQALGQTVVGINITNDGTTEKVVDIFMAGRSAISSDSKYYYTGGTEVATHTGDTTFDINRFSYGANALKPGEEVTDSKVLRVVVAPGNHVVQVGDITPHLIGGGLGTKGCPVHARISGGMTITAAEADLSDGKAPICIVSRDSINLIYK